MLQCWFPERHVVLFLSSERDRILSLICKDKINTSRGSWRSLFTNVTNTNQLLTFPLLPSLHIKMHVNLSCFLRNNWVKNFCGPIELFVGNWSAKINFYCKHRIPNCLPQWRRDCSIQKSTGSNVSANDTYSTRIVFVLITDPLVKFLSLIVLMMSYSCW
jgi:hypothetical protein